MQLPAPRTRSPSIYIRSVEDGSESSPQENMYMPTRHMHIAIIIGALNFIMDPPFQVCIVRWINAYYTCPPRPCQEATERFTFKSCAPQALSRKETSANFQLRRAGSESLLRPPQRA